MFQVDAQSLAANKFLQCKAVRASAEGLRCPAHY
jgi:hypothetical protein